jgi:hypothetical protein
MGGLKRGGALVRKSKKALNALRKCFLCFLCLLVPNWLSKVLVGVFDAFIAWSMH